MWIAISRMAYLQSLEERSNFIKSVLFVKTVSFRLFSAAKL